ncbi:MAG: hypothetical protein JSV88_23540 [Candidatus Aminicenantes bacterium]|nr:MAG: hypothetical protein JSV88_23540 [Candidatus Aminicenantes bacterium]
MKATMKATRGLIVNLVNYGFYQDPENYESHNESHNEKCSESHKKATDHSPGCFLISLFPLSKSCIYNVYLFFYL